MNYLLNQEQLLNLNDNINLIKLSNVIVDHPDYNIYINTLYNKRIMNKIDIPTMIQSIKLSEFKGLDLILSNEIDHNKKEINVWLTPVVLSA